jgi:plasmid rolling circle replication initiator protein Rep
MIEDEAFLHIVVVVANNYDASHMSHFHVFHCITYSESKLSKKDTPIGE